MAELVDALASGASTRKGVEVRVLFWAPIKNKGDSMKKVLFFRYLFFLLFVLSFPLFPLFLSNKQVSERENRVLAQRPVFLQDNQFNFSFGTDWDNYLKDHFPFRDQLITAYHDGIFWLNRRVENERAIQGKDGWFFHKDIGFKNYDYHFEDIKETAELLTQLNTFLNQNGIRFYLVFQPSKNRVYPEYYEDYIHADLKTNFVLELNRYLNEKTSVKSLYLLDSYIKNKNAFPVPVFEKPDLHPTGWGYYLAYREILNFIHADFPDLTPYSQADFIESDAERNEIGSARSLLNFDTKVLLSHHLKPVQEFKINTLSDKANSYFSLNPKGRYTLYYLGSSAGLKIQDLLKIHFKKLFFVRENMNNNEERIRHLLDEMVREKADIFIIEMPEDRVLWGKFVWRLKTLLYPEDTI